MGATNPEPITVLTPVYLDRPERWDYIVTTFRSFYRCCQHPGGFIHHLVDDRSPMFTQELVGLCAAFDVKILARIQSEERRGFFDTYRRLIASVETEFFVYLEPDHFFYQPCDFSPMLRLFQLEPELIAIYLRAPMCYTQFRLEGEGEAARLVTFDQAKLVRRMIDAENSGWLGHGFQHEGFSLMPTLWRTKPMQEYFLREGYWPDVANPYELEMLVDHDWYRTGPRLVAYLNAQAFCYHIGSKGGMGGGHTSTNDVRYQEAWSNKVL